LAHPTFPNERTKGISTETYAGLDFHWAFFAVLVLVGLGFGNDGGDSNLLRLAAPE